MRISIGAGERGGIVKDIDELHINRRNPVDMMQAVLFLSHALICFLDYSSDVAMTVAHNAVRDNKGFIRSGRDEFVIVRFEG